MHEVLVNRLGGLSLPRKSVVRLTDRPAMTLDVYRGRKTTMQQQQQLTNCVFWCTVELQRPEHLWNHKNMFELISANHSARSGGKTEISSRFSLT